MSGSTPMLQLMLATSAIALVPFLAGVTQALFRATPASLPSSTSQMASPAAEDFDETHDGRAVFDSRGHFVGYLRPDRESRAIRPGRLPIGRVGCLATSEAGMGARAD